MTAASFAPTRPLVLAAVLAAFLAAAPCPAAADGSPSQPAPAAEDPATTSGFELRIKGLVSLASPYGRAGGEVELAHRTFSLAAGAGAGARGPQLAGMLRARAQGSIFFVDGGLGLSGGGFSRDSLYLCITGCEDRAAPVETAVWTNLEVGGGVQLGWLHLRSFLGVGALANPGTFGESRVVLPYFELSAGFRLPL